ncbi:MAG: hypothetical protein WCI91_03635 [Candidatus Nomurabacteria bacterium]
MKKFEIHNSKKIDGTQLDLPLEKISKLKNNEDIDITHLGPDDLIEMQVKEPEEYEAFMAEIERQIELAEIEKAAVAVELEEKAEKNKIIENKREEELRALIYKAYDEEDNHISDASSEYERYRYLKLQRGGSKNKKERGDSNNHGNINNPNDKMSPLH